MRRRRPLVVAIAILAVTIAWRSSDRHEQTGPAMLPVAAPAAAAGDALIVEPDAGMAPIYALLSSPRHSLDMTMYELVDPTAEALIADDASRGVRVRIVLDHGLERARNTPAYDFLRARGVEVVWSSSRFFATHEKTFVIDDRTAVVCSLNLTDQYYASSRDVAIVDRDQRDVSAVEAVFEADIASRPIGTPAADDLVWSPGQSEADLLALIAGARRTVAVESEELSSTRVIDALLAALHRGVAVSIAMTYDPDWGRALDAIAAAGGQVSVMYGETPLYIHAKLLVVDAGTPHARAFAGSENLSDASLLHDRELGIILATPRLVDQVAAVVSDDVRDGRHWR
ncbi:MAG TPA: phospholipase D-like domain-containing protein [Mycobacteriales bacterium]|nr:phospholipase D-like domain-containing protein [Mycobacteriales bacterium]